MGLRRLRAAALAFTTVAGMAPAVLSLAAAPAQAAATCPAVDSTTKAVTPAPAAGVDWSGCDLTGANLQFAQLQGANLSGANLSSADVSFANLTKANVSGANLANANLLNIHLTLADLTNADFSGAAMTGVDMRQANIAGAILGTAKLNGVAGSGVTGNPASLPAHWFVASSTDPNNPVTEYLIGPTAAIGGADLRGFDLSNLDLHQLGIASGILTGANLSGTDLSDAGLEGVWTGGIIGKPAALPANWFVLDGYLLGPKSYADGANLAGADLTGTHLDGTNFNGADLSGANLSGLNLADSFIQTDLSGANLRNATFAGDFQQANLTGADLTGADLSGANLSGVTWLHTTCPDGSSSDKYVDGCQSALDTTPPTASPQVTAGTAGAGGWYRSDATVSWNWADDGSIVPAQCPASSSTTGEGNPVTVTASCTDLAGNPGQASFPVKVDKTPPDVSVTGIVFGGQYVLGTAPAAGCATTDSLSGVGTPASVTVSTTGAHGVGMFTAACKGATDVAGNPQAQPVTLAYSVVYGFGGFTAPKQGAVLAKSARKIVVTFHFLNYAGQPLGSATAAALAKAGKVKAAITGPRIARKTSACTWSTTSKLFRCAIATPAGIKTGAANPYSITALENVGTGLVTAPATGTTVNPQTVTFK